ncbi:FecR family protein [Aequorivita sp. H23M31]|uniref:FecR family protein n=1 Tax=Aequorivita ciconiae TaxID=2494375 RepID=A0A410G478_9FLAO|nr:FecR family protein [Aequorivita sp. H23M31]QAA82049.1 FecR family protein [Aequorivita sp. H23M31]
MKDLIIKYLNDTISEAEKLRLIEWLQTPKNQETFKEFVKINHKLQKHYTKVDTEKAYQELLLKIKSSSPKVSNKTSGVRKLYPIWLKYAAVVVGVAIIGLSVFLLSPNKGTYSVTSGITLQLEDGSIKVIDENTETFILDAKGNKISEQKQDQLVYSEEISEQTLAYNTLSVPYGKTFKLLLSDGSQVVLNAGSKLKFPVNFIKGEDRTVFLNGEAYFEVAKDTEHPFMVSTEDMEVKVLGTHFNVNSYIEDHKTYTVLVEGKVMAENKLLSDDRIILEPKEKVFFDGNQLKVEPVKVDKYVAWVQGQLVFVDDTFEVIKNKLQRKFNVKIKNNYPALNNINITATFTNESIEDVLKTFQTYMDFDWTLKDGVVVINKPKK